MPIRKFEMETECDAKQLTLCFATAVRLGSAVVTCNRWLQNYLEEFCEEAHVSEFDEEVLMKHMMEMEVI